MSHDTNTIMQCHFNSADYNDPYYSDEAMLKYWFKNDAMGNSTSYQNSNVQKKFGDYSMGLGGYSGTRAGVCRFNEGVIGENTSWSVDFWIKPDRYSQFSIRIADSYYRKLSLAFNSYSDPYLQAQLQCKNATDDYIFNTNLNFPVNQWVHVYIGRDSTTVAGSHKYYYAINGVITVVGTYSGSAGTFSIDRSQSLELKCLSMPNYSNSLCYVDEVRVSNKLRWNADFTPPTQEYTTTYNGEVGAVAPTVSSYGFIIGGMM